MSPEVGPKAAVAAIHPTRKPARGTVALSRQLRGLSLADFLPQSIALLFLAPLGSHDRMLRQPPRRIGERPFPRLKLRRFPFASEGLRRAAPLDR